jgi:hypothetical protein
MMDHAEIDETFNFYERRYNLTKMAMDCGISDKDFKKLNSRDKFMSLSYRLKGANKINLASFFFGKLFEVSGEMEALLNKIDCLVELGEYDEAIRYNNIGFELVLEDPEIEVEAVSCRLNIQKALIAFYTEKYNPAKWICEEGIIRFKEQSFYHILCAVFVANGDSVNGVKLFSKYGDRFGDPVKFLLEVFVNLLDNNLQDEAINFVCSQYKFSSRQKKQILDYINNYYYLNKDKSILEKYFTDDMKKTKKENMNNIKG